MKVSVLMYRQGEMQLFTTVLSVEVLQRLCIVPQFGKVQYGYQRPEIPSHVRMIKKYLLENNILPLLPTAMVLGVDQKVIDGCYSVQESQCGLATTVELDLPDQAHAFRIIDGQHRLRGLEAAYRERPELGSYLVPVNILVIGNSADIATEIDTFININSKAKRIKTDLAILAKHQLKLHEAKETAEYVAYICTEIGYLLNAAADGERTVWTDAIIVDPRDRGGIINIRAWNRSLERAVGLRLTAELGSEGPPIVQECKALATWFREVLQAVWEGVEERWPLCFRMANGADDEGPRYDEEYVLQRPIGVGAMHLYLTELLKKAPAVEKAALVDQFKAALEKSDITEMDWKVRGRFTGLTSLSGFRRVMEEVFADAEVR